MNFSATIPDPSATIGRAGGRIFGHAREKTRSKGDWLRHVRGVFSALRLDVRPLAGDGWLALCVENEAWEIIRAASNRTSRAAPKEGDTAQEDDTRDIMMPSARRRAADGRACTRTSFEIVKT